MLPRFPTHVNANSLDSPLFHAGFAIVGSDGMMRAPTTMGQTMDEKAHKSISMLPEWVQDLLAASTVEEGECLLWTGPTIAVNNKSRTKVAICKRDLDGGRISSSKPVRRLLLEVMAGKPLGKMVAVCTCGTTMCVNIAHLIPSNRRYAMQRAAKAGKFSGPAARARCTRAARTRAKLTDDQVREIMLRTETAKQLALEYGVSDDLINKIRCGKRRPFDDVWSNVFSRLAA